MKPTQDQINSAKGVVCTTDEVRAILDGKTQFRSVIRLPFNDGVNNYRKDDMSNLWLAFKDDEWITSVIPPNNIGDILYVIEPQIYCKQCKYEYPLDGNHILDICPECGEDFVTEKGFKNSKKEHSRIFQWEWVSRIEVMMFL